MKRWIVGVLILIVAGAGAWFGLRASSHAAESFRLVTVTRATVEQTVTTTGTIEPMVTVQVGTQVSGQISQILVDFNDPVEAGQVIARIDPSSLETAVTQSRINLRKSTADLAERQREATRMNGLFAQQLAAETDYAAAQYQLELAKASQESAQIDLERAEQNLAYATIRSPIDGIVVERLVDVGQTVAASLSAPQLFLLAADLSKMRILAGVDESDVGQIVEGQKVRFTVQAHPTERFEGVVRQVRLQPTLQDNVVSYTAVIEVDNAGQRLLPGMTATVDFLVATAPDVLTLSNAALRYRPSEELLARAEETTRAEREGTAESGDRWGGTARAGVTTGVVDSTSRGGPGTDPVGGPGATGAQDATLSASGERRSGGGRGRGENRAFVLYLGTDGEPRLAPVRAGITDGQTTAIESPVLEEGMSVIAGILSGAAAENASQTNNPFTPNQSASSGGRSRPGGF